MGSTTSYIKGGKENVDWIYTDDQNDTRCLTDWTYLDTDKTVLELKIPRTTTLGSDRHWCPTQKTTDDPSQTTESPQTTQGSWPIKGTWGAQGPSRADYLAANSIKSEGKDVDWIYSIYTNDPNDLRCMTNWTYYAEDGKKVILENIPRTINGPTGRWCATNSDYVRQASQNPQQFIPRSQTTQGLQTTQGKQTAQEQKGTQDMQTLLIIILILIIIMPSSSLAAYFLMKKNEF
jgi:hypothetical protein